MDIENHTQQNQAIEGYSQRASLSYQQPQVNGYRGPYPLTSWHSPPSTISWCPFWQTSGTSKPTVPVFGIELYFNQLTCKNYSDYIPHSLPKCATESACESCALIFSRSLWFQLHYCITCWFLRSTCILYYSGTDCIISIFMYWWTCQSFIVCVYAHEELVCTFLSTDKRVMLAY